MPDPDASEHADLERELREAAERLDPVPAHLSQWAVEAFTWRTIDAELAELVFDSHAASEPALVRGAEQPRLLTFRAGDLSIEVEIAGAGDPRQLVGQLVPAQPAEIDVETRPGEQRSTVAVDELGRFLVTPPADPGPLRLRCRAAGDRAVVTDWFAP
jgi:hypothetical protein